tara:strand:- start:514 stop:873 length:360 start_codon:yes stop_codon:yes gene_type:complete
MKFAIALAALLGVGTAPALAGVYLNVESNASYVGNDYKSRNTDVHIGFEGGGPLATYYIQGGPALINGDAVDGSTEFSGKTGINIAATERLDVYGEVSFLTAEDTDNSYGSKIGAKFKF